LLILAQGAYDLKTGKLPIVNAADKDKLIKFVALQLRAQKTEQKSGPVPQDVLMRMLPNDISTALGPETLGQKIALAFHKLDDPQAALTAYLVELLSWPYYGFSFFRVQQKRDPTNAWIGINKERVIILHPNMTQENASWKHEEVSSWSFKDDSFSFAVGDLMKPVRKLFFCSKAHEIQEVVEILQKATNSFTKSQSGR
jgi:hypothetical protein